MGSEREGERGREPEVQVEAGEARREEGDKIVENGENSTKAYQDDAFHAIKDETDTTPMVKKSLKRHDNNVSTEEDEFDEGKYQPEGEPDVYEHAWFNGLTAARQLIGHCVCARARVRLTTGGREGVSSERCLAIYRQKMSLDKALHKKCLELKERQGSAPGRR
jgi:hypothetical protein